MKPQIALVLMLVSLFAWKATFAETFTQTSGGPHGWNVPGNWSPPTVPDSPGAAAIIQTPTGDLSIDLGEEITVGTLTINKSLSSDFNTIITGTTANKLIMDGGGAASFINAYDPPPLPDPDPPPTGAGVTTLAAPIELASTLTVQQRVVGILQFTQPLSGAGGLTINRASSDLRVNTGVVELNAANTYAGATTFTGAGNGDDRYLVVRLNHADAIPSASAITLSNSAILELAAGDFTRSLGTGPGQITFNAPNFSGWSAFGADRIVNLGGQPTPAPVLWSFGNTLTLGAFTNNAMVDFKNPLDLGTGIGMTRTLRAEEGSAAIDGRISGSISGERGILKRGSGVLSFAAANTYAGSTDVRGGLLRLDHPDALPSGNLILGSGGVLGLGAANFARDLGTGANQVQFVFSGGSGDGGFSAHGANRTVVLNGGAGLTWEVGNFMTGNGSLILSDTSADSTLDFQNPIDLNGAARTVNTRNGSAAVDGKLSGIISGSTGSLVKAGGGTLELTAANTYDGGTTVDGGRLLVNNTTGSGTGGGAVTLNDGTLGGTGSIAGPVVVNTGARVAPGVNIESLDVGSLTLNTGSMLDFELDTIGGSDTSDLINVMLTDGLTIGGTILNIMNAGAMTDGTYTLIDYLGALGGSVSNIALGTVPVGFNFSLIDNTANTSIDLVVTAAPTGVPGDYNGDDVVDAADYVIWRKYLGTNTQLTNEVPGVTPGSVTQEDYDEWQARFGNALGSGTGTGLAGGLSVPEPTTILFVFLAAALITGRARWSPFVRTTTKSHNG